MDLHMLAALGSILAPSLLAWWLDYRADLDLDL